MSVSNKSCGCLWVAGRRPHTLKQEIDDAIDEGHVNREGEKHRFLDEEDKRLEERVPEQFGRLERVKFHGGLVTVVSCFLADTLGLANENDGCIGL